MSVYSSIGQSSVDGLYKASRAEKVENQVGKKLA